MKSGVSLPPSIEWALMSLSSSHWNEPFGGSNGGGEQGGDANGKSAGGSMVTCVRLLLICCIVLAIIHVVACHCR